MRENKRESGIEEAAERPKEECLRSHTKPFPFTQQIVEP